MSNVAYYVCKTSIIQNVNGGVNGLFNVRIIQISLVCSGRGETGMRFQHTEKSFRNLIKSNRNQIVFAIFRLIWNQTVVRLVPNQSYNVEYKLISVRLNEFSKKNLCVV